MGEHVYKVPLSLREQITEDIIRRIREMPDPQAEPPKEGEEQKLMWNIVKHGTLDLISAASLPACAVEEGDEEPTNFVNYLVNDCELKYYIHFKFRPPTSQGLDGRVDPQQVYGYYLGQLKKVLFNTEYYANVSYKALPLGNSPEIEVNDPQPGGYIIISVTWREQVADPYVNITEG